MNRYNPNYKALKPRSIGIVIKPITRCGNMFKQKHRKILLNNIKLGLKNKQKLLKRKVRKEQDFSKENLNRI